MSSNELKKGPLLSVDEQFEQLRRLTEISRALTYTTSIDQVTRLATERGAQLLDAKAAVLMLQDAEGLLHVRASFGIDESHITRFEAPMTDQLIGRLQGLFDVGPDAFMAVPLVARGEVTGIIAVATREPATEADEWLLSALADQAAVALENARLEDEVRTKMTERLRLSENATDAKDRALSTLAHDIRTPLGAIDGYCMLMEDEILGPVTDRQRDVLGRVRMSGRHLLSLLDNVMNMARLNAGVIRMAAEPVRLYDVAREAVHMLVPAADAKLQRLQLRKLDDVIVSGDHAHLRQVLVNLIGNAVKFTPPDGVVIITTGLALINNESFGEIRVTDNGPGIHPDEQSAVFEPYYRSEATTLVPGVGLGLAISHGLVREMGGELTLESELGAGATFIVRLPLLAAQNPNAEE